jgi:predicted GNAT family N-acyltransferase
MTVELFDVDDTDRLRAALELRFEVFVLEQGVPPDEEVDAHDRDDREAVHALVREGGRVVGTGRFYRRDAVSAQIGRMAIRPEARGRGCGTALLAGLLAEAVRRGYARAALEAQVPAVEFYRKAGFTPFGEPYVDAGILHQPMERFLIGLSSKY